MTFFEYMQQQIKRDDPVGDLAGDMSIDAKLFPSENLAGYDVTQWKSRIKSKCSNDKNVMAAFNTAVKEFENVSTN
jgi:hypothetical protein